MLAEIMRRHQRLSIPVWMMTHFGFILTENVEKQCSWTSAGEKQLHLAYICKTYRIMGIPFSEDRPAIETFSRTIEQQHAGLWPGAPKHIRTILLLGEMAGVSSRYPVIAAMLPEATRPVLERLYPGVSTSPVKPFRFRTKTLPRLAPR
jgi:hypothetical protein